MATMRGSWRAPDSVPAMWCSWAPTSPRKEIRFTKSRASDDFASRSTRPRSRATCGAFTNETGSSVTASRRPLRTASVRTRQS